ncbi:MAG TPA: mechanosensitive ion channel domain-containing protein [Nitrososphaeraceae archaeon]|nr:mechanosensitive ion channel domain-containing protein [Nitrososphaeraceae archaeon]
MHENLKYGQGFIIHIVDTGENSGIKENPLNNNSNTDKNTEKRKRSLIKSIVIMIVAVAVVLVASGLIEQLLDHKYGPYIKIAVVSVIGYFVINSLANVFYKLSFDALKNNAEIIRILIRIIGAIVIISVIISYLSQDPLIATSIGTITAIVIGFASQNVLGNLISGLYLAITRPFRIGEKVTVFGNTGIIYDIGLLYSRLKTEEGDIILAPNTSMVTTTIIIRKS